MAADGGQAQALIQLDSPASRILQTAYDAHHGQLGELEPFRNLVRSNDLSTDQLMLLHSGLKAPPLHLQNLAGHAEFGRFLALCAELNLTQAEADDLRAFFLGTQLTLDQLDELCQVVLDKAITAETLRAIQFIFANKAATDDAQRLFRQFLVCLALDHNVPEAELTHYEAPAGPTDAGVVQILCWPQMPQEQSQPFADLWQNDVCRRISFLKKLLPSWQKHLAIDLVPKRKRTPADGARSNEAIFGDDPLLGVYLELARQLVDLALYQPGHAGRVRGIFIWEGFVRQWFDATCGGGDMITLNGTTWLIYRPYHPSSLWRHASIEILQEHVEMFQAAASDLDFTINTNKLEDWLRNRPEQLVAYKDGLGPLEDRAITSPSSHGASRTIKGRTMVAKRKTTATPSASIVEPAQKRSRTSSGLAEAVPSNARCRPNFKKEPGSLYSLLKPTKFTKLGSVDVQEPSRVGHGLGSAQQPLDGSDEAFEELNPGIPFRVTYHSLDWRTKDFTVCVASSLADALRDSIRDATSSHGSAQAVESITRYPILISLDTVGAYSFRSELILHLNEDPWKDLSRRVQQEMAANKALEIKSCTSVLGLTTCVRTAVMILQGDASLMAVMRSSGGLWSTITELSAKSSDAERWSSWTPQQVSGFRDQFYAARGEQRRQADAEKTARKFYSAETRNRRRGRITRVIKNATAAQYARARELLRRPLDGAEIQPIRHSYRNLSCPLPDHVLELAVFKLDSDHEALDANHALAMTTHSLMIWCRQLVQRSVLSLGHFNDVLDLILITQDSDKSSCEAETVNVQVKLGDDTATSFFERLEAGIDSLVEALQAPVKLLMDTHKRTAVYCYTSVGDQDSRWVVIEQDGTCEEFRHCASSRNSLFVEDISRLSKVEVEASKEREKALEVARLEKKKAERRERARERARGKRDRRAGNFASLFFRRQRWW